MSAPVIADLDAEYGFLALLVTTAGQKHIPKAADKIKPEHFSNQDLGEFWRCMVIKVDSKEAPTDAGLLRMMQEAGMKTENIHAVLTAVHKAFFTTDLENYINLILSLYRRRMMVNLARHAEELAYLEDPAVPVDARLRELSEALADIEGANPNKRKTLYTSKEASAVLLESLQASWDTPDGIVGLKTGLTALDRRIRGLRPGCLYICAGRPSMGKSVFGQTVAYNVAKHGKNVLFLSQEMSTAQLQARFAARRLRMSTGEMEETRDPVIVQRMLKVLDAIGNMPFVIDDASRQTVGKMTGRLTRLRSKGRLDLLVVDYIGLMGSDTRGLGKVHQIEEITQGLKNLAKDLEIPVLALCQMSRASETREGGDKRPQLSDLRDSGAIEQDADVVMMLYRQEYYLERLKPQQTGDRIADMEAFDEWRTKMKACEGKAEIHTPKNRQGKVGADVFEFSGAFQEFVDLEADQ